MTTSHQPQKAKPSSETDANVQREELPTAHSLSSHTEILNLQRTIGNRATIQRLKKDTQERLTDEGTENEAELIHSGQSMEMQRVIQRAPLMGGDEMLALSPYTTNILGRKKASLYNTLVDALKGYEDFLGSKGKTIAGLAKHLDAVSSAAQAWLTKHGEGNDAKALAIATTRASAMQMKVDIAIAEAGLLADKVSIKTLYQNEKLWAKVAGWAERVWYLQENTHFYESTQTMTTVQQGKEIIARHLLDKKIGNTPASHEQFNVSYGLFNEAAALFQRPDAELTVDIFKALFNKCVIEAGQVWGDLARKLDDTPQSPNDSFMFSYITSVVPDIMGLD